MEITSSPNCVAFPLFSKVTINTVKMKTHGIGQFPCQAFKLLFFYPRVTDYFPPSESLPND